MFLTFHATRFPGWLFCLIQALACYHWGYIHNLSPLMYRLFQWFINAVVLFMFVGWWVWPYIQSYLPYEDTTTPDEVLALDSEIDEVLEQVEPNFQELYYNPLPIRPYEFLRESSTTPIPNQDNYLSSVQSVVYLTIEDADGWIYLGSGTILTADGLIMTNYHVIDNAVKVVVTTSDGQHYPVTGVVASDELLDITFLKVNAVDLQPIAVGDSDLVRIGDETLVIGHAEGFINTLSVGNVAGVRSYQSQGMGTNIQITNPISSGNSGGAVINEYGALIAIPTWSVEYDANIVQVQNLNFAIPINEALSLLKS